LVRFTIYFHCSNPIPEHVIDNDATVNELIDEDTKWWKINLINEILMVEEARIICRMAINPLTQSDKLVWMGTKNGEYSVHSGYHLFKEHRARIEGSTSNSDQLSQL
jgi:hypothetical protein